MEAEARRDRYACMHTHTRTHTRTYTHTQYTTHIHTHTHTHTHIHTYAHTHHVHACMQAWRQRLDEIDMSEGEATLYESLYTAVADEVCAIHGVCVPDAHAARGSCTHAHTHTYTQVGQTRMLLEAREARSTERVWLSRQSHGELDEARLVDGIAGK